MPKRAKGRCEHRKQQNLADRAMHPNHGAGGINCKHHINIGILQMLDIIGNLRTPEISPPLAWRAVSAALGIGMAGQWPPFVHYPSSNH